MKCNLEKYLPDNSVSIVNELIEKYPFSLKIVNERQTKLGDFKVLHRNTYVITINNNLNPYQFLITLIHEIAHLITFKKFGKVKPHGKEWKQIFKNLMLPFIHPTIFPNSILAPLANHIKNPKATTSSDYKLNVALKAFDAVNGKNFIFEIKEGSLFTFNDRLFKKGTLRRTRFECVEINTSKRYLFNKNAEVKIYIP